MTDPLQLAFVYCSKTDGVVEQVYGVFSSVEAALKSWDDEHPTWKSVYDRIRFLPVTLDGPLSQTRSWPRTSSSRELDK